MAEQINDNQKFTGVRLPENIKPVHYELTLRPDLSEFLFEGTVKIQYKGDGQTNSIVLHAKELEIFEGSVAHDGVSRKLARVTYSKDSEAATLEFADGGLFESGTLELRFKGTLNDKLEGFYRSAMQLEGETVYAATTQFEATDARRCFPCWDEPAVKSTFSVSLIIKPTLVVKGKNFTRVALSNMPEVSRVERDNGEVEVFFDKSPIMSTYLLAFIVGPFEMIEGTDGKRPIRVYTAPGKSGQGKFALEVCCKSLPYYEEYFGIEYPLPKMDLIAIPDFGSGAMENWGLVTYRETCLLFDPDNTSTVVKQYIALVVAHELAHQWFGNLVTMEWWTHLWLNEGFATFIEFLCVDHLFPEYDIWSQFCTDAYARAMDLDSLHSSHPIEVPVNHPSEIREIFDAISYNKGASVIRMLYNYIGDDLFRKGMNQYLTKFAYKNAVTEDLWAALGAASDKPVCKIMSGWTLQKGYPWLCVSEESDGNNVKLTLEQSKFNADGKLDGGDEGASWLIPISAITGSKPTEPTKVSLFEGKKGEYIIEGTDHGWIKLNPANIGLYRTAYSPEMAQKLLPAILDQSLPAMDRLGLQNDFFALCQAGKVNTVELLTLLQAFKAETNYTVWNSITSCVAKLSTLVANTDYKDKFQAFGRDLYADIFEQITWTPQPNEKHTDAMTRAIVINTLVSFEDEAVLAEAERKYRAHLAKSSIIPADLRGAVYKTISIHGDDELFESLFDIYRTAELHEEKNRVGRALGFSKDPARLERVIKFAFSAEVRDQDRFTWLAPIGTTNPPVAFKVLQDNKDVLREKFLGTGLFPRYIKMLLENFTTEESAQEVDKFFQANKFPGCERAIQQALETIRLNAEWLARDSDAIKTFLSK